MSVANTDTINTSLATLADTITQLPDFSNLPLHIGLKGLSCTVQNLFESKSYLPYESEGST